MNSFFENFVDLIFVDFFYNLQLKGELYCLDNFKVDVVDDYWDQFDSFVVYDCFICDWLLVVCCILKLNGVIWVIGFYYNVFCMGVELQNQGFWILNDVVWCKFNLMLNFCGKCLINVYEMLIWVLKLEFVKLIFNYEVLKVLNEGVQMCFDWVLLICMGYECLKDENGDKVYLM